jgi:hypothetical protein
MLASRKVSAALQLLCFGMLSACVNECGACGLENSDNTASETEALKNAQNQGIPAAKPIKPPYQSAHAPLADAEQLAKLTQMQTTLRTAMVEPTNTQVSTPEALRPELPDTLGDYRASADPYDGPSSDDGRPVAIVTRRYRNAQGSELYVKLTDTVQAKVVQAPLIDALTVQGQGDWGFEHGAILAGQPSLVRVYKSGGVSATLLVGGRYMFEIKLQRSGKEEDLARIAISLPFKMLGINAAGTGG